MGQRWRFEREGNTVEGVAVDIDPSGALCLRDDRGQIHHVVSSEIVAA
jgi:biotin-(acetyl-CoA carboxylase) ligase